jgi:Rieske 2Fe-2S family protein
MAIGDGLETVSDHATAEGRPWIGSVEDRRRVRDALLFPGWMTSLQPDYFLSYRLVPLAPSRTRVIAEVYFHAAAFRDGFDPSKVYGFWDRTNAEDRSICERQQRGLQSPSFEMGPYATVEDGVHAFDRRVAAAYLNEKERASR